MTPDKFFANYIFRLKLTFFWTRFKKNKVRGDKMVSRRHCVWAAFFQPLKEATLGAYSVTLKSSNCSRP